MAQHSLLSFGHGYSATRVGRALVARGWQVFGTTRSEERAAAMAAEGVTPLIWPLADLSVLDRATHLLVSAGPDEAGDPVLNALGPEIARRRFAWAGYLSTTGVYGDRAGGWVDETSVRRPATRRGALRAAAEDAWLALFLEHGLPLHIFRLAGIYGPGRGPFEKVRRGTARRIVKPGQVFSRIHVEDIARAVLASIDHPEPGGIYNICDDDPAPPEAVIEEAARLLHLPVPEAVPIEAAEMSPMARSFYAESKRVSNARMKTELGVTLAYPDYRAGLRALLAEEEA
ncbi:SDR family oxidoreductase [Paroceanicella profunda]|uniref:SDR family oxidoreductase n=1 Tax=Paroceanicella profunda TaxID=2579971 RepID=A0A5B8G0Q3_9RHOB|nr:SDR family oxidoreductase [Paroceanicella profunda]QDL92709.1 SDR family oxidoreductase [Paroceanicella profunda]